MRRSWRRTAHPSVLKQAQNNITALNIDVWGTCNTPVDADQCAATMATYASELPNQCQAEIDNKKKVVLQALTGASRFLFLSLFYIVSTASYVTYHLFVPRRAITTPHPRNTSTNQPSSIKPHPTPSFPKYPSQWKSGDTATTPQNRRRRRNSPGLQTYALYRDVGCLANNSTGAYCYVEAAAAASPADLYFYGLPWGSALPAGTTPSCSVCTKRVMALFAGARAGVTGLQATYDAAAEVAAQACGAGYVQLASGVSGAGPRTRAGTAGVGVGVGAVVAIGLGLGLGAGVGGW